MGEITGKSKINWIAFKNGSPTYKEKILITWDKIEGIISGQLEFEEDDIEFIPDPLGPENIISYWELEEQDFRWVYRKDIGSIN